MKYDKANSDNQLFVVHMSAPMYLIDPSAGRVISFHGDPSRHAAENTFSYLRPYKDKQGSNVYKLYTLGQVWKADRDYLTRTLAPVAIRAAVAKGIERPDSCPIVWIGSPSRPMSMIVIRGRQFAREFMTAVANEYSRIKALNYNGHQMTDGQMWMHNTMVGLVGSYTRKTWEVKQMDETKFGPCQHVTVDVCRSESVEQSNEYIIGSIRDDGSMSFSAKPAVHSTWISASAEAERLARLSPGREFVVMRRVACCSIPARPEPIWTE